MTRALILVDIQNDYFPDGRMALVDMAAAADNAAKGGYVLADVEAPALLLIASGSEV